MCVSLAGAATSVIFVTKYTFAATSILLSQAYFCRDKHVFVATRVCLDKKMILVAGANDTSLPPQSRSKEADALEKKKKEKEKKKTERNL